MARWKDSRNNIYEVPDRLDAMMAENGFIFVTDSGAPSPIFSYARWNGTELVDPSGQPITVSVDFDAEFTAFNQELEG